MATKFFNNENGDTLFAKLKGIVGGMGANFHTFQAVSGYFRSSGYFKLRNELKDTQRVQVLVGIDIDNVFRKSQREGMMFFGAKEDANRQYTRHLYMTSAPPATRRRLRTAYFNFATTWFPENLNCASIQAETSMQSFISVSRRSTARTPTAGLSWDRQILPMPVLAHLPRPATS